MSLDLRIGALVYKVQVVPELQHDEDAEEGNCDPSACLIQVARLKTRRDWLTLFHEALHAISADRGLGLSEHKVRVLEGDIISLLMDNPRLRSGLGL